jgi:hypothetical protein
VQSILKSVLVFIIFFLSLCAGAEHVYVSVACDLFLLLLFFFWIALFPVLLMICNSYIRSGVSNLLSSRIVLWREFIVYKEVTCSIARNKYIYFLKLHITDQVHYIYIYI